MIGRRCKIITFENVDEAEKKSPNKFGFRTTILIICTVIVPLKVVLDYRQNPKYTSDVVYLIKNGRQNSLSNVAYNTHIHKQKTDYMQGF